MVPRRQRPGGGAALRVGTMDDESDRDQEDEGGTRTSDLAAASADSPGRGHAGTMADRLDRMTGEPVPERLENLGSGRELPSRDLSGTVTSKMDGHRQEEQR